MVSNQKHIINLLEKNNYYYDWLFEKIRPYISSKDILEVGSGSGYISKKMLLEGLCVTSTDKNTLIDESRLKDLNFLQLDISSKKDVKNIAKKKKYGTIICLNVLEHIDDDSLALSNLLEMLKSGGVLILQLPHYKCMYNGIDKGLGHYRRYNKKSLISLLKGQSVKMLVNRSINFISIFPWFLYGTLFGKDRLKQFYFTSFNKLIKISDFIDKLFFNRVGLSLIVVLRKD